MSSLYAYDPTDQLVSETAGGVTADFGYDPYGNMVRKAGNGAVLTKLDYADGVHLTGLTVGSGTPATLAYDALGRLDRRTTVPPPATPV